MSGRLNGFVDRGKAYGTSIVVSFTNAEAGEDGGHDVGGEAAAVEFGDVVQYGAKLFGDGFERDLLV